MGERLASGLFVLRFPFRVAQPPPPPPSSFVRSLRATGSPLRLDSSMMNDMATNGRAR